MAAASLWAAISCWFTPSLLFLFLNLTIGIIVVISVVSTPRDKQRCQQQQQPQPIARPPSLLDRARSFNFSSFASGSVPHPSASEQNELQPHEFVRAPSLLDRARSFKFSFLAAQLPQGQGQGQETTFQAPAPDPADSGQSESELPNLVQASSLLDRLRGFNLSFKKPDLHHQLPDPEPPADGIVERAEVPDRYRARITHPEPELGNRYPGKMRITDPQPELGKRYPGKMTRSASSNPPWRKKTEEDEDEDDVDRRRPATVRERGSAAMVDEEVDAKADDFINRFKQQLKLQRLDSLLRYRGMHNNGASPAQ